MQTNLDPVQTELETLPINFVSNATRSFDHHGPSTYYITPELASLININANITGIYRRDTNDN